MKNTNQTIAIELRREIIKSKKGFFVCRVCLEEKELKFKATQGFVCKKCRVAQQKAKYQAKKYPKECSKCHEVSTNFTGHGMICRRCTQKYEKELRKEFAFHLGEKLLILWKTGHTFESAMDFVRAGKQVRRTKD